MMELPKKVYDLLKNKYNIIDVISFLEFDRDFEQLRIRLKRLKKENFNTNDKIIIEHLDTDFYFEHCSVGVNLLNFFNVVTDVDIPKSVFLFYTNHFGIQEEINKICKDACDRPSLIESFISNYHYSNTGYKDVDLLADNILYQGLCMMNITRSHRSAMFNSIKNIPPDNLILAATVN